MRLDTRPGLAAQGCGPAGLVGGVDSMWQDTSARYGNKMPATKASKREQSLQSEEVSRPIGLREVSA